MNTEAVVYLKVNKDILTLSGSPDIDWYDQIEVNGEKFNLMLDFEKSDVVWFDYKHIDRPLYLKKTRKDYSWGFQRGFDLYERVQVLEFA